MLEKIQFLSFLLMPGKERNEKGATATEYALLVGLIALAIAALVLGFGTALGGFFESLGLDVGKWADGKNS